MKVYWSAFSCEPGRGSEPGVGFAFAVAAAQLAMRNPEVSVTLVTRPHIVDKIEAALAAQGLASQLRIRPVSLPMWIVGLTGRKHVRIAYLLWQGLVAFQLRAELQGEVDAVYHHVTFATEALPTAIICLPVHVRRVLGPVGSPQGLNVMETSTGGSLRGWKGRLRGKIREFGGRLNFSRCDLVIAQADDAARQFERYCSNVQVEPNCAIDFPPNDRVRTRGTVPRLVSVGILEERKRHDLVIRALAQPARRDCELHIYGTGSQEQYLRKTAEELGVSERVSFKGWLPREAMLTEVESADCLVSASRQEGSAWSVAEAQTLGVPVVAFEGSGIETLIRMAGEDYLAAPRADSAEFANTIAKAVASTRPGPSQRWTARRLPGLLAEWYGIDSDGSRHT
jgi:glycosyltransferase involved in cell wall biosynthesis